MLDRLEHFIEEEERVFPMKRLRIVDYLKQSTLCYPVLKNKDLILNGIIVWMAVAKSFI